MSNYIYRNHLMTYSSWHAGEPNNKNGLEDCLAVTQNGGYRYWSDRGCGSYGFCFVCEMEA